MHRLILTPPLFLNHLLIFLEAVGLLHICLIWLGGIYHDEGEASR